MRSLQDMYGFEGPICSFSYDLLWQGDSFPALHTFEIMSVMSMLKSELGIDAEKISLYAEGYPSIPLAAAIMLFKERFKFVEYAGETYDFDEIVREKFYDSRKIAGKIFPEVLQNLWIPELLKWSVNKTNKE